MIVGHLHANRDLYPAASTAGQLDRFRLVVLRDDPVDDVAESLDLDERRDAGALFDLVGDLAAPAAEYRHPVAEPAEV